MIVSYRELSHKAVRYDRTLYSGLLSSALRDSLHLLLRFWKVVVLQDGLLLPSLFTYLLVGPEDARPHSQASVPRAAHHGEGAGRHEGAAEGVELAALALVLGQLPPIGRAAHHGEGAGRHQGAAEGVELAALALVLGQLPPIGRAAHHGEGSRRHQGAAEGVELAVVLVVLRQVGAPSAALQAACRGWSRGGGRPHPAASPDGQTLIQIEWAKAILGKKQFWGKFSRGRGSTSQSHNAFRTAQLLP